MVEFSKEDFEKIIAIDERLRNIEDLLGRIESKVDKNFEDTYNRLNKAEKELETVKAGLQKLKERFDNKEDRLNTRQVWWGNITNKIVAGLLIAALLGAAGFAAGEYTKNLEYKTPPNQIQQQIKKL